MRTRGPTTSLAWSLALACSALALACPPYQGGFQPTSAPLPSDAASATLELLASAPQGDWLFRVSIYGTADVESAEPAERIDQLGCTGSSCSWREYQLHCPRGMCGFSFQLAAASGANGPLEVAAGFVFEGDPGNQGCGDEPNPAYVPPDDRDRLFRVSWSVSDLVQAPFEDLDATRGDSGDRDAARLDADVSDAAAQGMDAEAPDSGVQDAASRLEPVRVIRGDPTRQDWWDLTVLGAELQAYEGKVVTLRIGDPDAALERLGSGQARIESGSFELAFPAVWEPALYKNKRAFIDTNANGRCDPTIDAVFADARGARSDVLTIQLDATLAPELFPASQSPAADCDALNVSWPVGSWDDP